MSPANFGFTSGAITLERGYYTADVTSYDYDCPITEDGRPNTKARFQIDAKSQPIGSRDQERY